MPFEDVGLWAETIVATRSVMSDSQFDWLFLPTQNTAGTPVGNNGLALAPIYSASPTILSHMAGEQDTFCNW